MSQRPMLCSLLIVLCSFACGLFAGASAQAAGWGISPDLQSVLDRTAAGERVPVVLVLSEQTDVDALLPIVARMDREQRREFALTQLKQVAATTQALVLERLATAPAEAEGIRSLWLGNGVAARLTPSLIQEVAGYPEVRTVLWDPDIPREEAEDIAGPTSPVPADGQRAILWHVYNVNAVAAWDMGFRGQGVVIAVLDSGVDRNHPDLANHIWANPGEIPSNGIDDDLNGYIDDTWGWDFDANDNNPLPNSGAENHGTLCAGAATGDGTAGSSTGIAPEALLMACKVDSWSENIAGIMYAIENGADVITMSRSQKWRFNPKPDYDWWRANTDAELLTGIFHANSIGNEGDNLDTDPIPFNISAPGNCPSPWLHPAQVQAGISAIVGCGAVSQSRQLAVFSSFGPAAWENFSAHWPQYTYPVRPAYQDYPWWGGLQGLLKPDVVAPGVNIVTTTFPGNGYTSASGTSLSTPIVAGVMALLAQANPNLTPEQMSMVLQNTATDLGPTGKDTSFGAGEVDAAAGIVAVQELMTSGWARGTVLVGSSETPIPDVLVEVLGDTMTTTTSEAGFYSIELAAGDYTLRFSHPEYVPVETSASILGGRTTWLDVILEPNPAGVTEMAGARLMLEQNQPNPFLPSTSVAFSIPVDGEVALEIFDVNGRLVRALARGKFVSGRHTAIWDGRDDAGVLVSSGVYLCRLTAAGEAMSRRMAIVR